MSARDFRLKNPFRSSPQFEQIVGEAVPKLKSQQFRLGQVIIKLTQRDKYLFKTCATALEAKNKERATNLQQSLLRLGN
jgi:division protein CdvB (Snf7/Vps24/ESCRT-III family)